MREKLGERVLDVSRSCHASDGFLDTPTGVCEVGVRRLRPELVARVDEVECHVERVNERHALERSVGQACQGLLEPAPLVRSRRRDLDALLVRYHFPELGRAVRMVPGEGRKRGVGNAVEPDVRMDHSSIERASLSEVLDRQIQTRTQPQSVPACARDGVLKDVSYLGRELHEPVVREDDVLREIPGARLAGRGKTRSGQSHAGRDASSACRAPEPTEQSLPNRNRR